MADFMDIVRQRRSIRWYTDEPVSEEALNTILEAGRWAQSWANTQCWEVIVLRDPAVKQAVQGAIPEGNPSHRAVAAAPVLLAVCARMRRTGFYHGEACTKYGDWFMFDLGIFTQNIALAAHALGLGSVVLGLFDQDAAKQALDVPEGFEVVALIPLGHPAQTPAPPPRRELQEFVHYDKF
jgi:nitroreductase